MTRRTSQPPAKVAVTYFVPDMSLASVAQVVAALMASTRFASWSRPLVAVSVALSMQSVPVADNACTLSSLMLRGDEIDSDSIMPLPGQAVFTPL